MTSTVAGRYDQLIQRRFSGPIWSDSQLQATQPQVLRLIEDDRRGVQTRPPTARQPWRCAGWLIGFWTVFIGSLSMVSS